MVVSFHQPCERVRDFRSMGNAFPFFFFFVFEVNIYMRMGRDDYREINELFSRYLG